jgi:hypothetical protein
MAKCERTVFILRALNREVKHRRDEAGCGSATKINSLLRFRSKTFVLNAMGRISHPVQLATNFASCKHV